MFKFKQFSINDDVSAMKIGTDSVLLGAWALKGWGGAHIVDAGSGTGIISLMLAQRFQEAHIDSIEVDHRAYLEGTDNINMSPWYCRIVAYNADFLQFGTPNSCDAIVSNPPFYNEAILSPDDRRSLARHGQGFDVESLIGHSSVLLKPGGRLSLIAPWRRQEDIVYKMTMCHLDVCRQLIVSPSPGSEPSRVLIEAKKGISKEFESDALSIRGIDGRYSPEYTVLTRAFYLDTTFDKK